MGISKASLIALGAVFALAGGAESEPQPGVRGTVVFGGPTSALKGHQEFCARLPAECAFRAREDRRMVLTDATRAQLVAVNDSVNRRVKAKDDIDQYGVSERWTYPASNQGDCEDYALAKRRALLAAGWPEQSLVILMVHTSSGGGHAVLLARTDKGDFLLDNLNRSLMNPADTDYDFKKAITPMNNNRWRSVTVIGAGQTSPT